MSTGHLNPVGAEGGTRTRTLSLAADFESAEMSLAIKHLNCKALDKAKYGFELWRPS